jgi:hypothetical protein
MAYQPHGSSPQGAIPTEAKMKRQNASPFRIFGRKQTAVEKLGRGGHERLTWEFKPLPGAGAGQYAWETYGLVQYPVFGRGNIHFQRPLKETFPAAYVFQAVGMVGIPPQGILQGQFITQPLLDPNQATALGVVAPGAVTTGPNVIVNGAPILNP